MINEQGKQTILADNLAKEIRDEYTRARQKFPKFRSYHEGLAVLWEEFEELKAEVFLKDFDVEAIRKEAIQVAAMALAMCVDFPLPSTSELGVK